MEQGYYQDLFDSVSCLAVVWAVQILRPSRTVALRTLHGPPGLEVDPGFRRGEWASGSLAFAPLGVRLQILLLKRHKNTMADAISRLPTWGYLNVKPDLEIPCFMIFERRTSQLLQVQKHVDSSIWPKNDWNSIAILTAIRKFSLWTPRALETIYHCLPSNSLSSGTSSESPFSEPLHTHRGTLGDYEALLLPAEVLLLAHHARGHPPLRERVPPVAH
eukprot:IDg21903t1